MKLNDIELCQYTLTIILQARQLDETSAQGDANALLSVLSKIEEAARAAQWRLWRMTDAAWVEVIHPKSSKMPKRVQEEQ